MDFYGCFDVFWCFFLRNFTRAAQGPPQPDAPPFTSTSALPPVGPGKALEVQRSWLGETDSFDSLDRQWRLGAV